MLQLHDATFPEQRCDFLLSCNHQALHKHCTGRGEPRIIAECVDTPQARREVFRALRAKLGAPEQMIGDRVMVCFTCLLVPDGVYRCARCVTCFDPQHSGRPHTRHTRAVYDALWPAASEIRARLVRGAFRAAAARARATNDADSALASRLKVLGTGMHVAAGWLSHLSRDDWCAWLMRNWSQDE